MKKIKKFEAFISRSYGNDINFIKTMEDSIEAIFIDMIDDGYELTIKLTDYGGNIGSIDIRSTNWKNAKPIVKYSDILHSFYDYIILKGYDFCNISLDNFIRDGNGKAISFQDENWEFIEKNLIESHKGNFYNMSIEISPIKTKWVSGQGYVPLYKIKKS